MAFTDGDITWYFSQVKGTTEDDITEADIISCVEFDHNGDFLATGDKGGRVVIFQRDRVKPDISDDYPSNCNLPIGAEFNVYSTFQSHEPEFDYLKSLEIEEKINTIKWLKPVNSSRMLLSTNDKTIKLWRVSEKSKKMEGYNLKDEHGAALCQSSFSSSNLVVPRYVPSNLVVDAYCKRVFANAHTYHVNSISVNSDQESFMSADDLRINLWNMEIKDQSFNIVDIKPANMEELTEVITSAEFHPFECNLFVYSSSKGTVRLCDMRSQALCDEHSKQFEEVEDPANRSFFSEIISSASDVRFSHSGTYLITRDYLTLKVWDLRVESAPVESYNVHEYLRSKLCSLYENDCIFDKFECIWSPDDRHIMTGSYNNFWRVFDRNERKDVTLEATREGMEPGIQLSPTLVASGTNGATGTFAKRNRREEVSVDSLDFTRKILHASWHPRENIIAIAATNNLYLFEGKQYTTTI